ncbi:MAG: glycosyltransferase [bacterium]|nr:glycosyltransferase [bacterium]
MEKKPAISVIVPSYNYAHYLGECMQGVIDQTFTDWEMIVVDDGSTDSTKEVVENIINKYSDKKIKYIYKEDGPSGTPAAINLGIKNSRGKYIAWLSSDDVYMPEKLEVQFDYMEKNPEVALTHTDFFLINEKTEITGRSKQKDVDSDQMVFNLLKGCCINGNTVLIRKKVFEELGLFRENDAEYNNEFPEIWRATEYEKWIEIAMNFKISLIHQRLHKARVHDENTPYNEINSESAKIVARRIIEKSKIEDIFSTLKEFPQDQALCLNSLLELAFLCRLKNWFDLAVKYLMEIDKMKRGFLKKVYRSFPRGIENLSYTEFMKVVLLGIKGYFNIDLGSSMKRYSKLGIQEGILLLQKGDYTMGRKVFEEWYEFDQGNIQIVYSLGTCYQKEGGFLKAIEKFQQVLSLGTDQEKIYHAGAHFHLGEIYKNMDELDKARFELEECLRYNPNHYKAKKLLETLIV